MKNLFSISRIMIHIKAAANCAAQILICVICLHLCGCGSLLGIKRADESFFVLTDNQKLPAAPLASYKLRLLVRETKASAFIDSYKIIFSENPSTRGYYQFAKWAETPPAQFTRMLLDRAERAGICQTVSRLGSSALGDIQLNTEILEFYHDTQHTPGSIVIRLNAELVDLREYKTLSERSFTKKVPVEDYSAAGAVAAFSVGTNDLLDELLVWLHKALSPGSGTQLQDQ